MPVTRRNLLAGAAATTVGAVLGRIGVAQPAVAGSCPAQVPVGGVPVIYTTDLNHPNGDLDDHIDLAVMHTLPGVDVRLVVLDRHPATIPGDGMVPFDQLAAVTGRALPVAQGLSDKMPTLQRGGATAILDCLRTSDAPITVVAVGSLRDVAAAINADRALCMEKIERLVVFAGDPVHGTSVEYNVMLDPYAFLTAMTAGIPTRWIPCFDGGVWQAGTRSSFVQINQRDVFPLDLDPRLLRFFTYRLRNATSDPLEWINSPVDQTDRNLLTSGLRNLWCAGLLGPAIGDGVMRWQGAPVGVFEPTVARWNIYGQSDAAGMFEASVDLWRVTDPAGWRAAMVADTVASLRLI